MKACQGRLKFECLRSLKLYRTAGCLDAWVIGAEGAADLLTFQLEWSSVTLTDKTGVTDEPRVVKGLVFWGWDQVGPGLDPAPSGLPAL